MRPLQTKAQLRPHLPALFPGLSAVALFLLWAVHDGGYDAETWYWGALAVLSLLAVASVALTTSQRPLPGSARIALASFAGYVAWSYLSITWAQGPGTALDGSNRALLYLLIFALMLSLPWTAEAALAALGVFAAGIGVIAIVLLVRFAAHAQIGSLLVGSRLAAPTGYINSTAALFTIGALVATALSTQRWLPGPVRGMMLAFAGADLQLALIVQSRGWLFTLPIIALVTALLVTDRLRFVAFAIIPVAADAAILGRLLGVFSSAPASLNEAGVRAGQAGLLVCTALFVLGTLAAWGDWLLRDRVLSAGRRRAVGTALAVLALLAAASVGTVATHGHPVRFVVRQWNGFSHQQKSFSSHSHFGDVGSGRYDFWRVGLDAFLAHPIGGLGQDNFLDYYVSRGRSGEEPSWAHSLEVRLLTHTGIVGLLLFATFLVSALAQPVRGRRHGSPISRAAVAVALLPLVVWLIHGSVDWFWEMPALSGPAVGFLGLASRLSSRDEPSAATARREPRPSRWRAPALIPGTLVGVIVLCATIVLGLGYLSNREISVASHAAGGNPRVALSQLSTAARLDPLNARPGSLGGSIALENGWYAVAASRFRQSLDREAGNWFAWLGAGLSASGLGQRDIARQDFLRAVQINSNQPANREALQRVSSNRPLTYAEAQKLFIFVH